jgi:hypothetical protein
MRQKPRSGYEDTAYGRSFDKGVRGLIHAARAHGLDASAVAKTILRALTVSHPRRRYAPAQHAVLEQILPRLAPERLVDMLVSKTLGLNPQSKIPAQKGQ